MLILFCINLVKFEIVWLLEKWELHSFGDGESIFFCPKNRWDCSRSWLLIISLLFGDIQHIWMYRANPVIDEHDDLFSLIHGLYSHAPASIGIGQATRCEGESLFFEKKRSCERKNIHIHSSAETGHYVCLFVCFSWGLEATCLQWRQGWIHLQLHCLADDDGVKIELNPWVAKLEVWSIINLVCNNIRM
jgi:hypothetical protein